MVHPERHPYRTVVAQSRAELLIISMHEYLLSVQRCSLPHAMGVRSHSLGCLAVARMSSVSFPRSHSHDNSPFVSFLVFSVSLQCRVRCFWCYSLFNSDCSPFCFENSLLAT